MMEAIYQVVGNGHSQKMYWEEFEEMFSAQFDGIENGSHLRDCLKGQPKIKGMCGCAAPCITANTWATPASDMRAGPCTTR